MQSVTSAERTWLETATHRQKRVKLQIVSLSDPNDVRLEIDTNDSTADARLLAGQVTANAQNDVMRSVDLTVYDPLHQWFPAPGSAVWLDALLRVYVGCTDTQLWPQGVYVLAEPEVSDRHTVHLRGTDQAALANGRPAGGFTGIVTIAKGTRVKAALEALIDAANANWGETNRIFEDPDSTLPYGLSWRPGSDFPWQAARQIASLAADHLLYYDPTGALRFRKDPDPTLLSPVWTFKPSDDAISLYISAVKRIDDSNLKNKVVVFGGSPRGPAVQATAEETSSGSSVSVSKIKYRIFYWRGGSPDPLITTVAEAQARADYELRRRKQWNERIPLRIAELPPLEPYDVIRIEDGDVGILDNYQVLSVTLPLTPQAEMQVEGWRVKSA